MSAPGRAPAAAPFQQFVSRLSAHWEGDAAILRHRGAVSEAITLESCAAELLEQARLFSLEEMTLEQAKQESGYSYSAIQKMSSDGTIPNVGKKGAPRIRRGDLPKKPNGCCEPSKGEPDLAELVLAAKGQPGDFS